MLRAAKLKRRRWCRPLRARWRKTRARRHLLCAWLRIQRHRLMLARRRVKLVWRHLLRARGLAKRARRHLLRVRRRVYRACCCLPRAWRRRGEEVRVRGECRRCLGYAAGLCKRADNVQARCSGVASALDTAGGGAARQSECAAGWAGSQKQAFKKWSPDTRLVDVVRTRLNKLVFSAGGVPLQIFFDLSQFPPRKKK
jgi:hypothetical protein